MASHRNHRRGVEIVDIPSNEESENLADDDEDAVSEQLGGGDETGEVDHSEVEVVGEVVVVGDEEAQIAVGDEDSALVTTEMNALLARLDSPDPNLNLNPNPNSLNQTVQFPIQASASVNSTDDFVSQLRPAIQMQINSKRSAADAFGGDSVGNGDEDSSCTICLENFDTSGPHRIVSLKCGHFFGKMCIEKWIMSQSRLKKDKKAQCPQCNANAAKKDIRLHYATKLVAVDTAELEVVRSKYDTLLREFDQVNVDRDKYVFKYNCIEDGFGKQRLQLGLQTEEIVALKAELKKQKLLNGDYASQQQQAQPLQKPSGSPFTAAPLPLAVPVAVRKPEFTSAGNVMVARENEACRVMSFDDTSNTLYVSRSTGLLGESGILYFNISDASRTNFIQLHTKTIRDIKVGAGGLVLTASMDRTLKLTNTLGSGSVVWCADLPAPAWSACFHSNPNYVFAGLASNKILLFDTRRGSNPVKVFEDLAVMGSPGWAVHSLTWAEHGLLAANIRKVILWTRAVGSNDLVAEDVEHGRWTCVEGSMDFPSRNMTCTSVCWSQSLARFCASWRSPTSTSHCIGLFANYEAGTHFVKIREVVDGFPSPSMTRNTIFGMRSEEGRLLAVLATGAQSSHSTQLWDITEHLEVEEKPATSMALLPTNAGIAYDVKVCTFPPGNAGTRLVRQQGPRVVLAVLTDKSVFMYTR